ncbi:unnamed protein product [Arabidopsis halleri]
MSTPSVVALSPHIDTHSAFRRYSASTWKVASTTDEEKSDHSTCIKKALYLPPRPMLLLSGEARYAWNHYIPHHKVRNHPCMCKYPQYCESQQQT